MALAKSKTGLGKGLSAVLGDNTVNIEPNDFEFLPIAKIEPRKEQPRSVFEEEALAELAASIEEHGVIQPLTVRRIDGGYYQIIAGERRWRASRMAGLTAVPARIIEADDKKAMELALVENLQREGLNPVEEARGYKTLMEEFGLTQEQVSRRVSKSRPTVANTLRLLELPEAALKELEDGALSPGAARALLGLESPVLIEQALALILKKELTVRQVEALVKAMKKPPKPPVEEDPDAIRVDYYAEAERQMQQSVGRRVRIVRGRKTGKIEIEYCGDEDLNDLIDLLSGINARKK